MPILGCITRSIWNTELEFFPYFLRALDVSDRLKLPLEHQGRAALLKLETRLKAHRFGGLAFEFLMFGVKQGWACLFGGVYLGLLMLTHFVWSPALPFYRYDLLFVLGLAIQALMLLWRLESLEEAKVIFLFHVVGTVMEVFKTHIGSWIYPEPSLLHLGKVPLFAGFMYSAVGSYIARIWRIFDIKVEHYPPLWTTWALCALSYLNFFSHHFVMDIRWGLFALSAVLFGRTLFWFKPDKVHRPMPILLGFFLVALFIWIGENIGTYTKTWLYPKQMEHWTLVSFEKVGSWFLLMMISVVLVSLVRTPEPYNRDP